MHSSDHQAASSALQEAMHAVTCGNALQIMMGMHDGEPHSVVKASNPGYKNTDM